MRMAVRVVMRMRIQMQMTVIPSRGEERGRSQDTPCGVRHEQVILGMWGTKKSCSSGANGKPGLFGRAEAGGQGKHERNSKNTRRNKEVYQLRDAEDKCSVEKDGQKCKEGPGYNGQWCIRGDHSG